MYDENNEKLNKQEKHTVEEPITTNFVMRDAEPADHDEPVLNGGQNLYTDQDAGNGQNPSILNSDGQDLGGAHAGQSVGTGQTVSGQSSYGSQNAGSSQMMSGQSTYGGQNAGDGQTMNSQSAYGGQSAGTSQTMSGQSTYGGQSAGTSQTMSGQSTYGGQSAGTSQTMSGQSTYGGQSAGASQTMSSQSTYGGQSPYAGQNTKSSQTMSGQETYIGQNPGDGRNPYTGQDVYGADGRSANQNPNSGQQCRPHYQEVQYQNVNQNGTGAVPPKKPKKGRRMAAKAAMLTAAALLFGTVSGGTMVGINWAADSYKAQHSVQVNKSEPLSDGAVSSTAGTVAAGTSTSVMAMDVSAIVEKAMPSVVAITNTVVYESSPWRFGPSQKYEVPASGSGIIVGQNDSELLIVTNNHVVEDSETLKVSFIDDTAANATIKGTDSDSDLAVIAVALQDIPADTLSQITIATLGDSDDLKVGQGVVAIGNALGYGQSVTVGYVSAMNRQIQTEDGTVRELLQTDAAINPGNSGGALLNLKGEVIGINSAKSAANHVEGMGYAIPISKAQDIINELMTKKTRVQVEEGSQGYMGIQGQNIDEAAAQEFGMPRGVYVYKIVDGGAASKSDLHEKDIITKFDGQSVKSMEELQKLLTYYEGGSTVTLTVQSLEKGQYVERTVDITLDYKTDK